VRIKPNWRLDARNPELNLIGKTAEEQAPILDKAPSTALRLELNAQGQKLNAINKELEAAKAAEKKRLESDKTTPVVDKPAPVRQKAQPMQILPHSLPPESPPASTQLKANDDNSQTANQGVAASGQGPANTSPGANQTGNLNADDAIEPQPNVWIVLPATPIRPVCI
jgi:hypothetical protein